VKSLTVSSMIRLLEQADSRQGLSTKERNVLVALRLGSVSIDVLRRAEKILAARRLLEVANA